jgi:hypothetical protein
MCDYVLVNKSWLNQFNTKLWEINVMADQKVDPNRPKDDQAAAGTTFQPLATPAVDEKGNALPLGPDTLEAQRAAWKAAEQQVAGSKEENPLEVGGADADVQNALQNPAASGPTNATQEDVKKQGEASQQAAEKQAKDVKAQQDAGVKTQATVTAERTAVATRSTSSQPHDEGPQPVKQEGDPVKLAQEEGKKVMENDPAVQHAQPAAQNQPKTADTPSHTESVRQSKGEAPKSAQAPKKGKNK